jgi:hypothetical protein
VQTFFVGVTALPVVPGRRGSRVAGIIYKTVQNLMELYDFLRIKKSRAGRSAAPR